MLAGTASSLISGNKMSGEQRRQLQLQNNIAGRLYGYGTGVPGSAPDEQAALAQQQAMLGEQQLQQRNQGYAALGANQGSGNLADFLSNLGSQQTAQRMAVDQSHLFNALAQRRQALLQASGVGATASQIANQQNGPPSQLPQMFGQIASQLAYNQALKGQQKPGGTTGNAGLAGLGLTQADLDRTMGGGGGGFTPMAQQGWPTPNGPGGSLVAGHTGVPPGGWATQGMPGGPVAPGNEAYGQNGAANQQRQSLGLGRPMMGLGNQIRQYLTGNGLRFG